MAVELGSHDAGYLLRLTCPLNFTAHSAAGFVIYQQLGFLQSIWGLQHIELILGSTNRYFRVPPFQYWALCFTQLFNLCIKSSILLEFFVSSNWSASSICSSWIKLESRQGLRLLLLLQIYDRSYWLVYKYELPSTVSTISRVRQIRTTCFKNKPLSLQPVETER